MVVKRYSNRRLYDTVESRYVTLDEVAERIKKGEDTRFVDAPTGHDITQSFLAQIILEGRGAAKLLPVPLLYRMVRMGDDALAEFFGRYVTWALDVYLKMKQGARTMATVNPFAAAPLAATDALMRWLGGLMQPSQPAASAPPWSQGAPQGPSAYPNPPAAAGPYAYAPPASAFAPPPVASPEAYPPPPVPEGGEGPWASGDDPRQDAELAALRAELESLKRVLREAMGPRDEKP